MSITSTQRFGTPSTTSPEAKALSNERKRIEGYIRNYQRDPKAWSNSMLQQLEMMSAQYQIPFKRQVPEASALKQMAATLGGIGDSIAFGFIPDNWYSDESTRQAANIGKIGGAAAQVAAAIAATIGTGGAAAPTIAKAASALGTAVRGAKGIKGMGEIAKAAGTLARTVPARMPVGQMASTAIQSTKSGLAPFGAKKGWKWAEGMVKQGDRKATADVIRSAREAIRKGDNLEDVVKGKSLTAEQLSHLTRNITKKYGGKKSSGAVEQEYLKQLSTANTSGSQLSSVTKDALLQMANKKFGTQLVNEKNVASALKKLGNQASDTDVATIVTKLKAANITRLKDAAPELMKLAGKSGTGTTKSAASFSDIGKMDVGMGALGAFGAGSALTDYTPSREELEKQEDPYDPYNL